MVMSPSSWMAIQMQGRVRNRVATLGRVVHRAGRVHLSQQRARRFPLQCARRPTIFVHGWVETAVGDRVAALRFLCQELPQGPGTTVDRRERLATGRKVLGQGESGRGSDRCGWEGSRRRGGRE